MASSGKRKTTMAKLNRERRLVEKRLEKQAKKLARKRGLDTAHRPAGDPHADEDAVSPGAPEQDPNLRPTP
jgi:hypothetical protein